MSKKKILLADDDQHLINYLSCFIPLLGNYEIDCATDGMQALAKLNAFEPEILILDILMPRMNGLEVLHHCRKNHPSVKVLIITQTALDTQDLITFGAHAVLFKPFDLADLSQKLKNLLPLEETRAGAETAKLLVADDEPVITDLLKLDFESMGLTVYTAEDGEEAVHLFHKYRCNLAVLDLRMPKLDGIEVIRLLRASLETPVPKQIMLITAALGINLNELKRLECPVFQKPVNMDLLKQSVLQACARHALALTN